jgi:hypothetical protein
LLGYDPINDKASADCNKYKDAFGHNRACSKKCGKDKIVSLLIFVSAVEIIDSANG